MSAFTRRADAAWGNVTAMLFNRGIDPVYSITPSLFDNEGTSPTGNNSDVVNITPEATAGTLLVYHYLQHC
eukprot:m.485690 g.485690  ORF g.485690 m.485690 type:complete len:71 (+) comp21737_c0_seq10:2161-2373(+)